MAVKHLSAKILCLFRCEECEYILPCDMKCFHHFCQYIIVCHPSYAHALYGSRDLILSIVIFHSLAHIHLLPPLVKFQIQLRYTILKTQRFPYLTSAF